MFRKLLPILLAFSLFTPIVVKAEDELYLGGDSIGIEVQYDGVVISGTYAIHTDSGLYDPKDHGIEVGDRIIAVNEQKISSMNDLYNALSNYQNPKNELQLTIVRNQEPINVHLLTQYNKTQKNFQSGLYIKDKITGVGTLTFYDPTHKTFGALGHEIMDSDLKEIADVHQGTIYPATVTSITKAQEHIAGEKHATIAYHQPVGTVTQNTPIGIYGTYDQVIDANAKKLPWAKQSEIHTGKAMIYTVLNGDEIKPYEIEITRLHKQKQTDMKGIEFAITDQALLQESNGVIQGMSGSPIVQDGKIIGAITHVITSDPHKGYGVYIEWMLEQANQN